MLLDTRAGVGHHDGDKIAPHLERIVSCVVMVDNSRVFPRRNTAAVWLGVWMSTMSCAIAEAREETVATPSCVLTAPFAVMTALPKRSQP
jgi:hypothetical protein